MRKIKLNNQVFDLQPDVFGLAVESFYENQDTAPIEVHVKDFDTDLIPVDYLFRNYDEMPMIEKTAIDLAKGKVLDVGCCAGSHLLELKKRNHNVFGIDISEKSVDVCQKRGLAQVVQKDFFKLDQPDFKNFDTIFLLMNGIGIVKRVDQLNSFFSQLKTLIKPDATIYLDSTDLSYLFDTDEFPHYYGEMSYQISYKNQCSPIFEWLYLDFGSLKKSAERNGFNCCFLMQDSESYLAKLSLL
ncbi:MAG: class I SAM-dependent methyltransferase [Flavobacteriaceae bacterium]|nr:class I SAM-dependent methyltransferase [Psychroflexus sp.]